MFDFIEWLVENKNKPLDYIFLAALVFIIDRFGRKFITSQVKRLFHIDDKSEFKQYVSNQARIESKLDAIMRKEGITWIAPTLPPDSKDTAMKRKKSYLLPWMDISAVHVAKQYINYWRYKMTKINKALLLPLLAAIALFVKQVWGFPIEDEYIDLAAEVIMYIIMILGIFMNPKKNKKTPKQKETSNDTMDFTTDASQ